MNAMLAAYTALGAAIILEVSGSTLLKLSQQFTKLWPSLGMLVCFILSLYCLSLALKMVPLGVAYAVWAGLGIVLTAVVVQTSQALAQTAAVAQAASLLPRKAKSSL